MQCNEKRKFILPHSSVQLSANAESRVRVWAEEFSSSSTLEAKRGEEGEQVAYLALGLQGVNKIFLKFNSTHTCRVIVTKIAVFSMCNYIITPCSGGSRNFKAHKTIFSNFW